MGEPEVLASCHIMAHTTDWVVYLVCMYVYVCIEMPNWAKGRDPSGSWVQYPNPAVLSIPRHSRWFILTHVSVLSEPTLLEAAKGVLCPHVGGTETHQTHFEICATLQATRKED